MNLCTYERQTHLFGWFDIKPAKQMAGIACINHTTSQKMCKLAFLWELTSDSLRFFFGVPSMTSFDFRF